MVIEIEYQEGLDALLSRRVSLEEIEEIGKEILYYVAYILPGVGIYRQFKKPKSKRSTLGTIGFSLYTLPFALKIAFLPAWVGAGISTGEWRPFNQIKNIIENTQERKDKGNLEKTVHYHESESKL